LNFLQPASKRISAGKLFDKCTTDDHKIAISIPYETKVANNQ